jgi:hypothetical protein
MQRPPWDPIGALRLLLRHRVARPSPTPTPSLSLLSPLPRLWRHLCVDTSLSFVLPPTGPPHVYSIRREYYRGMSEEDKRKWLEDIAAQREEQADKALQEKLYVRSVAKRKG